MRLESRWEVDRWFNLIVSDIAFFGQVKYFLFQHGLHDGRAGDDAAEQEGAAIEQREEEQEAKPKKSYDAFHEGEEALETSH